MSTQPIPTAADLRALSEQALIDAEVAKTRMDAARRRFDALASRVGTVRRRPVDAYRGPTASNWSTAT